MRLQPPIITSSDCEGAGEVFTVSSNSHEVMDNSESSTAANECFFKSPKFLTVSSQLHLEAFVHEHPRVWAFSPTFRAEKSDTPRHLSEFWMLEVEMRTASLSEIMSLVESLIKSLVVALDGLGIRKELICIYNGGKSTRNESTDPTRLIEQRWQGLTGTSWPRITYKDAMDWLSKAMRSGRANFDHEPEWSTGLQVEHERFIVETIGMNKPVFVTDYPTAIKPFYMLPSASDNAGNPAVNQTVACFDLLLPEMSEIVGGSLREHRLECLMQNMRDRGMDVDHDDSEPASNVSKNGLEWYIDLRRFGSVPHGGFGLGFDRLLGYLAGVNNIKDTVPWPRYYGRCDC